MAGAHLTPLLLSHAPHFYPVLTQLNLGNYEDVSFVLSKDTLSGFQGTRIEC